MGEDIIAFVEVNQTGDWWQRAARVFLDWDGLMFNLMLGMKGDDDYDDDDVPQPKGLPRDRHYDPHLASDILLLECMEQSWLTTEEFSAAIRRRKAAFGYPPLDTRYEAALVYMECWPEARLVFGFY